MVPQTDSWNWREFERNIIFIRLLWNCFIQFCKILQISVVVTSLSFVHLILNFLSTLYRGLSSVFLEIVSLKPLRCAIPLYSCYSSNSSLTFLPFLSSLALVTDNSALKGSDWRTQIFHPSDCGSILPSLEGFPNPEIVGMKPHLTVMSNRHKAEKKNTFNWNLLNAQQNTGNTVYSTKLCPLKTKSKENEYTDLSKLPTRATMYKRLPTARLPSKKSFCLSNACCLNSMALHQSSGLLLQPVMTRQ